MEAVEKIGAAALLIGGIATLFAPLNRTEAVTAIRMMDWQAVMLQLSGFEMVLGIGLLAVGAAYYVYQGMPFSPGVLFVGGVALLWAPIEVLFSQLLTVHEAQYVPFEYTTTAIVVSGAVAVLIAVGLTVREYLL